MGASGEYTLMALIAQGIRTGNRFMLTCLLVAPKDIFQQDTVFGRMTIVAIHRI
jgi:hypothetical protein